jgi:predicted CxxxxCH...CXXCH cytochrome family protein
MCPPRLLLTLLASLALTAACASERHVGDGAACVAWREDVEPAVGVACAGCHGGATPAGGYALTSYLGALADVIAGDASSKILSELDPQTADDTHRGFATLRALLTTWIVDCDAANSRSPIHKPGILNPADADFHGRMLQDTKWDFAACTKCHGEDFSGGTSGVSCLACHADGPTACTTCHGPSQLASGAHPTHLGKSLDCSECHVKPTTWTDPGHVFNADGSIDLPPAEVTFGAMASLTPAGGHRKGSPAWDEAANTCANVYCHGGTLDDAAAQHSTPIWNKDARQIACDGCHGDPPASHGGATDCKVCHSPSAPHIDGVVNFGDGSGGCTACHGGPSGPAPPRDVSGETSYTAIGVGAHQAHLTAPHRLSSPIPCATCHVVPAEITSPGHIDSNLPAEVTLAWDRTSQTCGGTCHGATSPMWTSTPDSGQVYCGSCHGIPPATSVHIPTWTLQQCVTCHAETVDPWGNILVPGKHMNGVVDHAP